MKLHLLALTALCFAAIHAASPPAPSATNVYGTNVTYRGIYANEIEGFVGIRFAESTAGKNRFRPPVPWQANANSVIDADDPGPACPQSLSSGPLSPFSTYSYVTKISEDCLRLNVWRPNGTTASDKLPVLVFIYGGSFVGGTKDGIISQPGGMQLQSIENGHPVMNVEMNYRLGIFGFAQSDALYDQGSLNAGVRDQRAALDWVRDNIAAFGGDPDKVTIHGQSSGGLAVGIQVMAYGGSKPVPFRQAICESQCLEPGITGNFTLHRTYRAYLKTNCSGVPFQSKANVECLQKVPMETLLEAQLNTTTEAPRQNDGDNWLPAVDGDFIPDAPSTLMAAHRFGKVDMIIGWCDNDAMLFTPTKIKTAEQTHKWVKNYLSGMTEAHVNHLLSLYPSSDFHTSYFPNGTVEIHAECYRTGRIFRDVLFTCQPIYYGQVQNEAGQTVYFYDQNQTLLTEDLDKSGQYGLGVVHTSELVYVFGNLTKYDLPGWPYHPSQSDYQLATHESRSWSSFVSVGQPSLSGHSTLQGWDPADFGNENYGVYVIGGPYSGYSGLSGNSASMEIMAAEKLQERCGFLNSPEIIKELQY